MLSRRRAPLIVGACVLSAAGLFFAYLRMARAVTVNSDGASNALQAWDLFHGNPLLRGWTLSDVSFYPTELIQYGLIQLFTGVTTDQIHVAAAMTWTMVVLLAASLAWSAAPRRSRSGSDTDGDRVLADGVRSGRSAAASALGGWLAAAIAVAILLVPAPGLGYQTLLSSPNHTGSAVPLLLAWLLLDRARDRAWLPYAVAVVLAWGAIGDPLVTFVGAVPLVAVAVLRALRRREFRGVDARLALAGVASVVMSHATMWALGRAGGFHAPSPPIRLSPVSEWPDRAATVGRMLGILFGTGRPAVRGRFVEGVLQAVHLPGLVLAVVALLLTVIAVARGTADRVDAVLAAAVACDIGAEIVSTLPIDLLATREIAPVLPMSAVLAARVAARWLTRRTQHASAAEPSAAPLPAPRSRPGPPPREGHPPVRAASDSGSPGIRQDRPPRVRGRSRLVDTGARLRPAAGWLLAVVLAAQIVDLVAYAPPRAEPVEGQEAAEWLERQGLRYGLGSYWVSNNITVGTSRRVTVVPTLSDSGRLVGMCWQTHTDMYDASAHDARFVLLERERPMYGTAADVLTQYGTPVLRHDTDAYMIFVYDRNLLEGFATTC